MGCIIEKYPNTKLWEKLLEIEADVENIIQERLVCTQNSPSLAGTGETIRFSVSVIDNDTGPIAEDRIVAGTYDLTRVRNNIETTIVDDGAFSKRDGFVYVDIDFDTATWNLDDSYILIPNQNSTAEIDGTVYHLPLSAWSGMILDLSSLETAVNTIISTLGTPVGASLAVDIADIEAKLDHKIHGLAALNADLDTLLADVGNASWSTMGSLYAILGNPAQTFTAMVGYEGATSLANKLTLARAGYLDNINQAGLLQVTAARAGYLDQLAREQQKTLFYSDLQASATLDITGTTDVPLPSVTIPNGALPSGHTFDKAYCHLKYGSRKDSSGADNAIVGNQHVQVQDAAAPGYTNAVLIVNNSLPIDVSEATVMGGDVVFGNIEVSATISAENKTYNFQWTDCQVTANNMILYDVQTIIEVRWH